MKSKKIIFCVLFVQISHTIGKPNPSKPIKSKNFSFAIPAFLLGGGLGGTNNVNNNVNNGNLPNYNTNSNLNNQLNQNTNMNNNGGVGNNLFRQVTVTRTILSTVATVTAAAYRTCTTSQGQFLACGAGRRRRSAAGVLDDELTNEGWNMLLVIGSTTISDQSVASMILNIDNTNYTKVNSKLELSNEPHVQLAPESVTLYPSDDSLVSQDEILDESNDSREHLLTDYVNKVSSKTPPITTLETTQVYEEGHTRKQELEPATEDDILETIEHARINLAGTTTVTRTFPVTAVVSSFATGAASLTLTVSYAGCSPQSLPVTGVPLCGT